MYILGMQKTSLLDYPGKTATVLFTGGCNFRCPYCHNGELVLSADTMEAYSEEEVFSHLRKRKNVLEGVVITGGEPTLQPDLKSFIAGVKDLGYMVKLDTNGTDTEKVRDIMSAGLIDYIAMDIKNSFAKYKSTIDRDIDYETVIKSSIDLIMRSNVPYEFRTTVTKEHHTPDDIEDIARVISGAEHYYIQPYKETDTVIAPGLHRPEDEVLYEMERRARRYVATASLRGDI